MSPSTTPVIPAAPFSSLSDQATLEGGFDHLRDWSSDGGYMRYGSQVDDTGITYAKVRGWDRDDVVLTHALFFPRAVSLSSPIPVQLRGSLITSGVTSMTRVISKPLVSALFPPPAIIRKGRLKPSASKLSNCQYASSNCLAITSP